MNDEVNMAEIDMEKVDRIAQSLSNHISSELMACGGMTILELQYCIEHFFTVILANICEKDEENMHHALANSYQNITQNIKKINAS